MTIEEKNIQERVMDLAYGEPIQFLLCMLICHLDHRDDCLRSFMAPKAMDWELRPCAKVSKNP
jgi:hypothetical protein